jgi:hypothetical protein
MSGIAEKHVEVSGLCSAFDNELSADSISH